MLTKKELLNQPRRDISLDREYSSILVIPNRKKHDSGWMCMTIIGVYKEDGEEKYEICSDYSDDINWDTRDKDFRMDCFFPQGIMRFWGYGNTFKIVYCGSSIGIKVLYNKN